MSDPFVHDKARVGDFLAMAPGSSSALSSSGDPAGMRKARDLSPTADSSDRQAGRLVLDLRAGNGDPNAAP